MGSIKNVCYIKTRHIGSIWTVSYNKTGYMGLFWQFVTIRHVMWGQEEMSV